MEASSAPTWRCHPTCHRPFCSHFWLHRFFRWPDSPDSSPGLRSDRSWTNKISSVTSEVQLYSERSKFPPIRATHRAFRSPISSLTLFSLLVRARTRDRLSLESLRASLVVRCTSSASSLCLKGGGRRSDGGFVDELMTESKHSLFRQRRGRLHQRGHIRAQRRISERKLLLENKRHID